MKITEYNLGRCTGCCAAALSAGVDRTYDFLLGAPVFLHPAEKDAKNAEIRPGLYNKELKNIDEWLASQDFFEPLKPIKRRAKKA